ncbi:MAG: hypothetical protein HC822_12195, partial [Oscillochloris sp.]|nr:hypothetical protein [Oscillochloris sp.]
RSTYCRGRAPRRTLVTVSADEAMADSAYRTMQRYGAVDINERGTQWRESGWTGFDTNAGIYDADDDHRRRDMR